MSKRKSGSRIHNMSAGQGEEEQEDQEPAFDIGLVEEVIHAGDVWIPEETFGLTEEKLFSYKHTNVDNQQVGLQHWSQGSMFLECNKFFFLKKGHNYKKAIGFFYFVHFQDINHFCVTPTKKHDTYEIVL